MMLGCEYYSKWCKDSAIVIKMHHQKNADTKIHMELQETQTRQNNLEKQNKIGWLISKLNTKL